MLTIPDNLLFFHVQIKDELTFWRKPCRAQQWWNWTWFSKTGIQLLDISNLQTVGTGRTRYMSRKLRMQQVTAHHHTSPPLPRKTITTDGAW